jgi:hypothetical protein
MKLRLYKQLSVHLTATAVTQATFLKGKNKGKVMPVPVRKSYRCSRQLASTISGVTRLFGTQEK